MLKALVRTLVMDRLGGGMAAAIPVIAIPKLTAYLLKPLLLLKRPWVNERVQRLEDAIIRVREAPSALAGAFAGALVVQITLVAFYLLTAKGLSVPVFAKRCLRFSFVGSVLEHARRCCDVKLREVVTDIPC